MEITPEVLRKYGTANPVLMLARDNHDPRDEFAWVQEWRFAISDYLHWHEGEVVLGFSPGAMPGPDLSLAYLEISEYDPTAEELWYALDILDRYREWLRMAGKDY